MFKEEYQKRMDQVSPDARFLAQLEQQMKEQENTNTRVRIRIGVAMAACCAVVVLCLVCQSVMKKNMQDNVIVQNAGGAADTSPNGQEGLFTGSSWYGEETDPENIYKTLIEMITWDDKVVIASSNESVMKQAETLNKQAIERLAERMQNATYLGNYQDNKEHLQNEITYYMFTFEDGSVVKCEIAEETYFYCSDFDAVYVLGSEQ